MSVALESAPDGDPTARIRAAILDGTYAPGQRLVESELGESFAASRGAIRAALGELTHEGLVERIANRGARVRVVSVDEAVEITEVRMVVEGLCAAKAAEHVSAAEAKQLRAIGTDMQRAVDSGDVMGYSGLNQRLHDTIARLSGQSIASGVLVNLRARNVRHQFRLSLRPGRPGVSLPQHLAIIEAICTRDPAAAEQAVRAHLGSVIEALKAD